MDEYDYLRFAALVHDLGKVWNRKQHEKYTIDLIKSVNFLLPDEKIREVVRAIDKTHSFGNPNDDYWLLKIADRSACNIQRNNEADNSINCNMNLVDNKFLKSDVPESLLPTIQSILHNQFREHFIINDFDLSNLRKFIRENQWLELVRADVNDHSESSLREHLLMTEQILNLLIEHIEKNPTKNLSSLQKSKKLDKYLKEKIEKIPKPNSNKIDLEVLSNLIESNKQDASNEVAIQFKITTEQIKNILEKDKILITNGGSSDSHKSIIIPVSMLTKFLFCNYQPYLQYIKFGKKIKINGDFIKNGDSSHKQMLKKEKAIIGVDNVMDGLKQSSESDKIFTFHEIFLKAEIIPGIILIGSVDRIDVWKGRMMLTERKFVKNRTQLKPYENEILQLVAYALLLKKNFGIEVKDAHCSIELYDIKNKQLLKKFPIEIEEKHVGIVKKLLWDLGAIVMKAKIPEPTKNQNKCRVCRLNANGMCDKAVIEYSSQ